MNQSAMDEDTLSFSVTLFHALAHPTRLRMIELLTERGCTVTEVANELGLLQPNASQHLAILSRSGLLKVTRNGASRGYSMRGPRIPRILELVREFRLTHAADLQDSPEVLLD